jgi:hypothetical protein
MLPVGAATALRPAYGGLELGLNAISGRGIIKYKKGVYPNKTAVHQWGGGLLPLPQEGIYLNRGRTLYKLGMIFA